MKILSKFVFILQMMGGACFIREMVFLFGEKNT